MEPEATADPEKDEEVKDEAADAEEAEAIARLPKETTVTVLCEKYGSQMDRFPTELVETLAKPTTIRDGKEAFLAFRYGSKRFKITFEQIDRLRIPKEAK